MRIALDGRYIQDHFPGIGRYTYEIARWLPVLAPEAEFLLLRDPCAPNSRFALDEILALPNVGELHVEATPFALRQQWAIAPVLRRNGVALYHSPYYLMPYALPCKTVATIHDLIPLRFPRSLPNPRMAPVYKALIRLCARRADHLIADSASALADLEERGLVAPTGGTRIYLGVEPRFRPQPPEQVARYRQTAGLARPYALYLGINKPHKNLPALLRAWAQLPAPLRDAHALVLAGAQDARYAEGPALADALGLGESVRFLGGVQEADLPLLYAGATCFVFPSLYEGFGLPILEAMACGAPVACSSVSSMPEVAGDAALLFDPAREGEIAAALTDLLTDEPLRRRLAQAGQARARQFTWERTAAETLSVYRRLLGTG